MNIFYFVLLMNIGLMNKYRPQRNPANDLQLLTGAVSVFARVCWLGRVRVRFVAALEEEKEEAEEEGERSGGRRSRSLELKTAG